MQINVMINDREMVLDAPADEFLSETLRRYGFLSVKRACETSTCGLCTVWLDKKPVLSCSVLSARAEGKTITTIEAVQDDAEAFAEFMVAEGAEQCGFCAPGFTMTVLAMRDELDDPSEAEIAHYLAGNLCRCSGYVAQHRAVKKYLESLK